MASTDATPVPRKGVAYEWGFPFQTTAGKAIVGAAGIVCKVGKDQASLATSTNAVVEQGFGWYYITFTNTEFNADRVIVSITTTTTGAVDVFAEFFPQEAGDIKVDLETIKTQTVTAAAGVTFPASVGTSTFASGGSVNTTQIGGVSASVAGSSVSFPTSVASANGVNVTQLAGSTVAVSGGTTTFPAAISSLTQTQVTGGGYALNSASFAFNAALDFTTAQKAATVKADIESIQGSSDAANYLSTIALDYGDAGVWNIAINGNVYGDVQGKVLGGGASTITGIGTQSDVRTWLGATVKNMSAGGYIQVDVIKMQGNAITANAPVTFPQYVAGSTLGRTIAVASDGSVTAAGGGSSDPWNTLVPAAYPSGTAGFLFGRLTAPAGNGPLVPVPDATEPSQTNAYLTTFNGQGGLQGRVSIEFIMLEVPSTDSYTQVPFLRYSNTSGQLVTPLRKSTQYKARRENGDYVTFTTGSNPTYALPAILGL